jgi:long-chain acyl-CoA synthetase
VSLSTLLDVAEAMFPDRIVYGPPGGSLTVTQVGQGSRAGSAIVAASGARALAYLAVNGPALPVGLFAAAAAGVPFVPVNYRLPATQIAKLLTTLEDPLVICDEASTALLPAGMASITTSQWLSRSLAGSPASTPALPEPAEDGPPAVVLFTSGTTAQPKAVQLSHANLLSYVLQTTDPGSAAPDDAALVAVPPYHIAGIGSMLTNLYAGRRVVYMANFTAADWIRAVRDEDITFAMLVPTMLVRVVEELAAHQVGLPSLRALAYGGARIAPSVVAAALRLLPDVAFVNAYGLTETSSTIALLGPEDHRRSAASADPLERARLASIGRPVPGIEIQIRSEHGQPLPAGQVGGLWVRGPQVSGRYAGTGSVLDAGGWFGTGDRAYVDAAGYIFILGRGDDTIIRGGENVAPAEVEDVLTAHPDVRDAAVIGAADLEWGERIVAFVVARDGAVLDLDRLRAYAGSELRASRMPSEIILRPELPYNATGKLLRRQLRTEYLDENGGLPK